MHVTSISYLHVIIVAGIGLRVDHRAISPARESSNLMKKMDKSALAFLKYPNYRSKVCVSRPVFASFPEPLSTF